MFNTALTEYLLSQPYSVQELTLKFWPDSSIIKNFPLL